MSEFENKDFNVDENAATAENNQPQSSEEKTAQNPFDSKSADTAAGNSDENATTYHYAYRKANDSQTSNTAYGASSGPQPNYQNNYTQPNQGAGYNQAQNTYYQQPQNSYYSQATQSNPQSQGNIPAKKSNSTKVFLIILIVCLVVAAVALVASITGRALKGSTDDNGASASQSQSSDDAAKVSDSGDVPLKDSDDNYTVAGVAQQVMDSCVGITVYSQQADAYNYFYGYGSNGSSSSSPTQSGEGSGIIMAEQNGKTYVITCAHVISDGDSFMVTLNDGTELEATMVGYDSQTDIGVLSIDKTGLEVADFADSTNVVVGEQVVAIGCPGGLEFMNSVTSGYVSALDRPISSSIGYDNECIQIDAAINPGNSGGALFNMQGQVIGVNSSKIASTEYEGMGFAVPSSTAIATANSLIKVGYVEGRAKIGIKYNTITNYNNASSVINALAQSGFENAQGTMVINSVDEDSDLVNKDIKQYDMIVAVNSNTMTSADVMTSILAESKPGDTIKLTIARIENNEIKTFEVDCVLIESKG